MMQKMNTKLKNIMKDTTEREKIRLFYELGKHFVDTVGDDYDDSLEDLFADIANVVQDIENL